MNSTTNERISCTKNGPSFFEVRQVLYGQHILIQQLLISDKEFLMSDKKLARELVSGDIILGMQGNLFGMNFFVTPPKIINRRFTSEPKNLHKKSSIEDI